MTLALDIEHRQGDFTLRCAFDSPERVTGLFGPSGAGKSSLLRIIAGLTMPDRGRVTLAGRCVFDSERGVRVPAHKRRIGFVFQQARLFAHLNVRHNLRYGAWFAGRRLAAREFDRVIDMLDIGHLLDRRVGALSGGEAQRVAIGRALFSDPAMLLLDEPLASLDADRKREVLPYIERLSAESQLPIVFVSHQLDELLRLANRWVVALRAGAIAFAGPTAELMADPALLSADQARDAGVLLRANVRGAPSADGLSELDCDGQSLYVPALAQAPGTPVTLHIRARDVMIAREKPAAISALNLLETTVERLKADGDHAVSVFMQVGGQSLEARVTRRSAEALALAPGQRVYAVIKSLALAEQAWERLGGL